MANALWREISDEEKEEIRKEAKSLLNEFGSKLSSINAKEIHPENEMGTRQEGTGWQTDSEFRDTTFTNAPLTYKDFIVAEKGGWKK